ncbi:ATP-binding protein [Nocardioides sp. DS6]|uniref:histidine kinase n=1 Tax=Nocardioides eburneus TaxID=3231482 RepID=A0ABV3T3H5_9ACTN
MSRSSHARRWALSTQGVALLVALLLAVVLLLLGGAAELLHRDLQQEYEQRALAIARSVAQQPGLATDVTASRPTSDGPVQRAAEAVRRATGALYVVVTDVHGVRYSHTNPANIGKVVSTSPDAALAGREVVVVQRGTLGISARGKVPLRDARGRVVGEVSVGISMNAVNARTWDLVLVLSLIGVGALAVGVIGAVTLGRRLRRTTLGLQPEEMADLLREHAAVLGGVRDGILAVDTRGLVTVANPEAARLLGVDPERGQTPQEAGVPASVRTLLEQEPAPAGTAVVLGERVVVAHRLAVERDGRSLGTVLTLRDRSDLDEAARELEATRALTDALRAQAHEHRNRLHALGGMLHLGRLDRAKDYLEELQYAATWVPGVDDSYLAGLLAAKAAVASEAGVRLEISPSTYVAGTLTSPLDVVTVLANLLDNAIRAAAAGDRPPRVEVTLLSDGADLLVHVADSGDGVPPALAESVFGHGVTTRAGGADAHGLGLSLARHTARRHGGDVRLLDAGGPDGGAVFEARMAGVVAGTIRVEGAAP